jgi:hypothetical protein
MVHPLYFAPETLPQGVRPITEVPLLVLVGLTGVGKSSLLEELGFATLPDRRQVVDRFVLPLFGHKPGDNLDRAQRFELTRRFRERHKGGVAEALRQGHVQPTWPLLFDGLRGEAEVAYGFAHLPLARFVVLEASDLTRLSRLLNRGDSFDRVKVSADELASIRDIAKGVLGEAELKTALSWNVPPEDLLAKLKIVAEERKNYDPSAARLVLGDSARALFLDTEALSVAEEAQRIRDFVRVPG